MNLPTPESQPEPHQGHLLAVAYAPMDGYVARVRELYPALVATATNMTHIIDDKFTHIHKAPCLCSLFFSTGSVTGAANYMCNIYYFVALV